MKTDLNRNIVDIRIIAKPYVIEKEYGVLQAGGTISIGEDFSETIMLPLDFWSIRDYERQWREGLERIKTYDTSCLVASVYNPILSTPLINWWTLYKEGRKVFIYNQLIAGETYPKWIGSKVFSPDNCYEFIKPRFYEDPDFVDDEDDDDGDYQVSEWVVELE